MLRVFAYGVAGISVGVAAGILHALFDADQLMHIAILFAGTVGFLCGVTVAMIINRSTVSRRPFVQSSEREAIVEVVRGLMIENLLVPPRAARRFAEKFWAWIVGDDHR
jgi:xanthosine utilization system XapX-like protein